jgi:hypothetical protein
VEVQATGVEPWVAAAASLSTAAAAAAAVAAYTLGGAPEGASVLVTVAEAAYAVE